MLRFRSRILAHILYPPSVSPIPFHPHRLLSAAAPAVSAGTRFALEDYLVDTCGLTPAHALKASTKLSHLKSPAKPDAVLALLAGLGLSRADVAAVVSKDPKLLCAGMERTLAPVAAGLTGLGLSHSEVARLVSLAPKCFRGRSVVSNLPYYLSLLGSSENLLRILKKNASFLARCPEKVVKPTVALLRECGLGACDIAKLCIAQPWLLNTNLEHVQAMVARAEALGVPRGSGVFRLALQAVAFLGEDKIAARVKYFKNMFSWSDAEVAIAVCRLPAVLALSKDMLQSKWEFLISEVELEPAYIAHLPALLGYSLDGRLKPRYYVLKFLKENGLVDRDRSYYSAVKITEKVFVKKYISPHNEVAPYLAEDYAAACKGEVPARLRST